MPQEPPAVAPLGAAQALRRCGPEQEVQVHLGAHHCSHWVGRWSVEGLEAQTQLVVVCLARGV